MTVSARNETSITLKWEKVGGIPTYFLRSEAMTPMDVPINDTTGGSSVEYVVTSLTAGKKYSFTIITTFEGANSTGFSYEAVTGGSSHIWNQAFGFSNANFISVLIIFG